MQSRAGCGSGASATIAACLRALPASKIFALDSGPYHSEILGDGQILPGTSFRTLIQQGKFNHMPVISGTVEDEQTFSLAGTEYAENPQHPFTATDYQNMVNSYGPPTYPLGTPTQLQTAYPLSNYSTPALAMDAIGTDYWACTQRGIDGLLGTQVPVYAYEFDDRTAPSYYPPLPGLPLLAYHTGDIQYLFPLYHGSPIGNRASAGIHYRRFCRTNWSRLGPTSPGPAIQTAAEPSLGPLMSRRAKLPGFVGRPPDPATKIHRGHNVASASSSASPARPVDDH